MVKTVAEIARLLDGQVVGDGEVQIKGVSGIDQASQGDITFLAEGKYEQLLETTAASAIIVPREIEFPHKTLVRVADPRVGFAKVMRLFYADAPEISPGVHPSSAIARQAQIGQNVRIGAMACIEENAVIGDDVIIFPGVFVGRGTQIGSGSILHANVTVREGVTLGRNVIVHSGAVIGSDGFGYAREGQRYLKIPQIGSVIVEDDVEIGANVTIDRGTLAATRICQGAKIDNLVQIAHNVVVGPNSVLIAQVGISGSSRIGAGVTLAGQVGVVGHIEIGDNSIVGAQSGVSKSIPPGAIFFGSPARPHTKTKRIEACLNRLPELFKKVRDLEKRLTTRAKDGE
ncbi:UDP-3-O-(3-hydroxymyristoyl)glucosamine N-acyltransferase [Candidatus Zixiibacteriota bacterium]